MEKEILEIISGRRSIYPENFTTEKIEPEEIRQLLEAVRYAPTHKLTEPWRFRVYMNKQKNDLAEAVRDHISTVLEKQQKGERTAEKFNRSQAVIVVSHMRDARERVPEWEELAATVMAVQNFWINTQAYGMGGYFSTGKAALGALREYVKLEDREKIIGLFYLGKHQHSPRKRPAKEVDDFTKWYI